MKLDSADRPKVIVLGVLLAVFIGYGAYTLFGKKVSAAPAPPSVREAAVKNAPNGRAVTPEKDVAVQMAQAAVIPLGEPVPKKDPFNPCISVQAPTVPAPPLMRQRGGLPNLPAFRQSLSPLPFSVRPSGGPMLPTVVQQDPKFVLTGIIQGVTAVAIIRAGDSGRHIVKVGQLIDGKYFVKFIGRDRVVLTEGCRSIDLRLGGGTNAS
jgi:hypothetical protein